MFNLAKYLCTSVCALSLLNLYADDPGFFPEQEISLSSHDSQEHHLTSFNSNEATHVMTEMPSAAAPDLSVSVPAAEVTPQPQVVVKAAPPAKKVIKQTPVKAFTGKVKGKKVRLRLNADLDSSIVKELNKGELLTVVGEKGDFWAVEAPSGLKAYVFRSYVLDDVVEGNHVNVRLNPSVDAPILATLNSGDRVRNSSICATNNKWMEIAIPSSANFYIAKNYVENAGSPEVKAQYDSRKQAAEQLLESAQYLSKTEFVKNFQDIDFDKVTHTYQSLIHEYADFPHIADQAKEELARLQESYIDKRIAYMETKPSAVEEETLTSSDKNAALVHTVTDKMKLWEPIEESLYLSWANINENRAMDEYYSEQKTAAVPITGILEPYSSPVKCKPGDFIIKDKDLPVAYVYSTQINLQNLVGKRVTVMGTPRPNNNFAFPAYFVLAVE